jgi:D-alanyl-D-alanine carboxypeptidase
MLPALLCRRARTSRPIRVIAGVSALIVTSAALLLAAGCDGDHPLAPAIKADQDSVSLIAGQLRTALDLPAVAVALVHANVEPAVAVTGVRRVGTTDSVSTRDLWHIGSNAKAMTAMMIGALVERGQLRWTSTPGDVFPDQRAAMNPRLRDVTVVQLLSHHAGIRADTTEEAFDSLPPFSGSPTEQRRTYALRVLHDTPSTPPGTYVYSNAGYVVAAAMAEEVSHTSWETLMQRYVYDPLSMDAVKGWPGTGRPNQPWGHVEIDGTLVPDDPNASQLPPFLSPAGDVSVSMGGYASFVQSQLRGLAGRNGAVSAETVRMLHTVVGDDYALGWQEVEVGGAHVSTHQGSAGTFYATVAIRADRDVGAIVITNVGSDQAALSTALAALRLVGIDLTTAQAARALRR